MLSLFGFLATIKHYFFVEFIPQKLSLGSVLFSKLDSH